MTAPVLLQNCTGDQLPEAVWKPLGAGYQHYPEFFLQYCSPPSDPHANPNLSVSLESLGTPEAERLIRSAGFEPRCLIQGITCPYNGTSLRRYLGNLGLGAPRIQGVDIIDVDAVARAAGYPLTEIEFRVRDAAKLMGWTDNSVEIVVQDHLLNCAPHAKHEAILRETVRVLSPEGVLILNFSVEPQPDAEVMNWSDAEQLLQAPLNSEAYSLADVVPDSQRLAEVQRQLLGKVITDGRGRRVLVTRPYGNFEFYSSYAALTGLLSRVGLRFAFVSRSRANGPQGPGSLRYRTLVQQTR